MNEPKKTKRRRKKCVLISQNEEKTCDFGRSALTFLPRDFVLFNPNRSLDVGIIMKAGGIKQKEEEVEKTDDNDAL